LKLEVRRHASFFVTIAKFCQHDRIVFSFFGRTPLAVIVVSIEVVLESIIHVRLEFRDWFVSILFDGERSIFLQFHRVDSGGPRGDIERRIALSKFGSGKTFQLVVWSA
jgi:hypothetical protein